MRITNILLVSAALVFAGCNSTPVKQEKRTEPVQAAVPARIEIQEAVGFTIFEDSNITGELRLDYDRAQELLAQGKIEDAIELLEKVAEAAPTLSAPRIDLGIAYHQLGAMEAAEAHLNTALAINASHPVALNELGIVYRKTARFSEARQSYQAALDVYPGFHYARRNLAVLCDLYLADLDCAVENYEAYMATVDSDDEAATWLKNARFRAGLTE
ncbi:MAG: tetratricopeptide repeat protein [Woeseiaceae bacterium]